MKGQVLFELHQKWCFLFTAGSWEKDTILVQFKQIFGPAYFVTALVTFLDFDSIFSTSVINLITKVVHIY